MKKVKFLLLATSFVCLSGISNAQTATNKMAATEEPTPANTLKWTKEVLPKMELLVPKLEKIKGNNTGQSSTDALKLLASINHLKTINAKGTRLKAADAKRYYDLIAETVNSFYIQCKSVSGNICCMDCQNHGILGIWCFANCFVAKFPGID